ncbi:MAG: hypothetical protein ACYS8Z_01375 [Planctomycetota bacterium]|jgi:hypothetical protein
MGKAGENSVYFRVAALLVLVEVLMKTVMTYLCVILLLVTGCKKRGSDDAMAKDPNSIITKVVETYRTMQTYTSQGKIVSKVDSQGERIEIETVFSIKLKKPNLYLISWTKRVPSMPERNHSGVVWNAGGQPYLYWDWGKQKMGVRCDEDMMALVCAGAASDTAAFAIPWLFLEFSANEPTRFARLIAPYMEKSETAGGAPCYVVSGTSDRSEKETYWISKDNFLVVKYQRSLKNPKDSIYSSNATDAELDEFLMRMEREITNENRELLKKAIELRGQMGGNVTETHTEIASPELSKEDFEYKVPQGTVFVGFDDYMKSLEAKNANEKPSSK